MAFEDRPPRYKITCPECGAEDEVLFKPREGGRPVLCRECFKKRRRY